MILDLLETLWDDNTAIWVDDGLADIPMVPFLVNDK